MFVDDWANGDWVLLYWELMLLYVMGLGRWNVSRVIRRLCEWINETLWVSCMPTQNSLVIINMEPQPSDPSSIPRGKQFSVRLWSLLTTLAREWFSSTTPRAVKNQGRIEGRREKVCFKYGWCDNTVSA